MRKGRLVHPGIHPELLQVARLGGRLDCVSLLRHHGVFVLDSTPLHLQMDPLASRVPRRPPGTICHWRPTRAASDLLVTPLVEALIQAIRCQEPRAAIATLDSAWHLGLVDEGDIAEVFAQLPRRHQALRPLLDRRSESGPETLVRLILRSLGCEFDLQVEILGVGRVDFVVDGWLVVECDSEAHHSGWAAQKRDRRRDLAAARLGYTTVRLIAEDIMWDRESVQSALREVVARGSRRRGARNS